jgi:spermidine/putrescine transport system ATP-binding protein
VSGGAISLVGLTKAYDDVPAVRGIDLEIAGGEFFSLLGPSGCGKTTTLRMLAGFERPDTGQILLDGTDLAPIPPHRRPVNTVFQTYALFPFLDVWHNVEFGLRYRKLGKSETRQRVGQALEMVRMDSYAKRRPAQLSGGQQQRVALARALVLNPSVLLLDEPLGALDAKLRKELQLELKSVQKSVGITFVYVTHDQEEALTMSDRLAVMADGLVEQIGTPETVYSEPASAYVAGFLGSANVVDVEVQGLDTGASATASSTGSGDVAVMSCRLGPFAFRAVGDAKPGPAKVVIRPERVLLGATDSPTPDGASTFPGLVDHVVYLGPTTHVVVRLSDGQTLLAAVPNAVGPASRWYQPGSPVSAHVHPEACRLLPPDTRPALAADAEDVAVVDG